MLGVPCSPALLATPPQRTILLTALEIARGLEYLHHPDRRMVHRDLSAANVLLATAAGDERGFKALLSDFGGWPGPTAVACCMAWEHRPSTERRCRGLRSISIRL